MIICKTYDEVEMMRKSALLVSKTLTVVAGVLKPGITTISLDKLIGEYIRDHHAVPHSLVITAILTTPVFL